MLTNLWERICKIVEDIRYFLQVFKLSNHFVSTLKIEFAATVTKLSDNKLSLYVYGILLYIAGFLWVSEYIPQNYTISTLLLTMIAIVISMIFTFAYMTFLIIFTFFMLRMMLKDATSNILRAGIFIYLIIMTTYQLIQHPVKFIDPTGFMLHDFTTSGIVLIIAYYSILVRFNITKLMSEEPNILEEKPNQAKYNCILKYFKNDNPDGDKTIRNVIVLWVTPFFIFQTTIYKATLLSLLLYVNMFSINQPTPLSLQQYQLLQPSSQDCRISLLVQKLIAAEQFPDDKTVCIDTSNIMRQEFADEFVLIAKSDDGKLKKISCNGSRCIGAQIKHEKLVSLLLEPKLNFLELVNFLSTSK